MSCCDDTDRSPLETIPAGLPALPRQLRGFPEVRRDLLRAIGTSGPLADWRPSGDDFGLMWLEMWAYVADVLGFYDERTANETYLRTAVRRSSLRRIVELLGHTPRSGVAGSATVAAIADGAVAVTLPPGTGFRSGPFANETPQVFETTEPATIHPLKNQWIIRTFKRRPTVDPAPDITDTQAPANQKKGNPPPAAPNVRQLLFETAGFGLAANELVLFESRQAGAATPVDPRVSRVTAIESIEGKDLLTYNRVTLAPPVRIELDVDLSQLRARRPTQTATPTRNEPVVPGENGKTTHTAVENLPGSQGTRVYIDLPPGVFRRSESIIVARNLASASAEYRVATIDSVRAAAVKVTSIPPQVIDVGDDTAVVPSPSIAATELILKPTLDDVFANNDEQLTFHYSFVDGGQPTNVGKTELGAAELGNQEGVLVDGIVTAPPDAVAAAEAVGLTQTTNITGELEQEFLLADALQVGALVEGRLTFTADGRGTFEVLTPDRLPPVKLRLPITIYGNVVSANRGESVAGEVLGDGNARIANQRFKLRKKPLTYLQVASGTGTALSTLQIRVDGVLWREVRTFFGQGPEDTVYTARHDDEQNTIVTFGDGVRGARLPSGVKNVIASYRFGTGEAAPPAASITQIARAVKGLRGVRAPVAAAPGKDPDRPEELRTNAPRSALLFGRAVSAADFEALAREYPGVVQARAEWLWLDGQMQAGVAVHFVGNADAAAIAATLRAQADPTVPIAVTRATPIPATASIGIDVDPRFAPDAVAAAVKTHLTTPGTGVLSLEQAGVGGTFWPSVLFEAVSQVRGVVAVSGLTIATTGGPVISNHGGTCIETGKYLDFSSANSVTVTAIAATGTQV